ncbi:hypothetical protein Ae201684P_006202 [Aphanomyces euteiches]|nr:hypothetical protein Ae201684P_006202 [Aphanomyces euteiches]
MELYVDYASEGLDEQVRDSPHERIQTHERDLEVTRNSARTDWASCHECCRHCLQQFALHRTWACPLSTGALLQQSRSPFVVLGEISDSSCIGLVSSSSSKVAFVVASHRESFPWASARITAISTEYQPRRHIKDEALGGLSGERLLELIGKISMWGCHSLVSITRSSELSLHCQFKALRQMIGSNEDFGKVWTSPQARRCGEKQIDHPSPPLSRLASLGLLVDSLRGEKARNIDLIWSAWILVRFLS